jgi:ATP-dependent Clp protease ATP-binding subunit ClpX
VAIFKHLSGERYGNLMMIGNSGTGKTTVMRSMERMYMEHEEFEKYRVVVIMNAPTFATEEGVVDTHRLFVRLEERARQLLGDDVTADRLKAYMEHATVCLDEIDKCSGMVGGKPYVTGINIQQALLTLIEGERVTHQVTLERDGVPERRSLTLDTGKMLFLCAGAFENLYDQVFKRVTSPTSRVKLPTETVYLDGQVQIREYFTLRHHFRQEDLFDFGMQPQFLSRFDNWIILEDLNAELLKKIFMDTDDSVFRVSRNFFRKYGIELEITDGALDMVADEAAAHKRIGARSLKGVWGKIIKPFEFDPFSRSELRREGDQARLVVDEGLVGDSLKSPLEPTV